MDDRAEVAVDDVHERMMAFVDEPEEVVGNEENQDIESSTPEEEGEEGTQEESDQESSDDEPIMEIQWGDEKKLVNAAEAKDLAEKGYNYTQNMQLLAEQRRSMDAKTQAFQSQVEVHTKLADVVAEVKSIDNQIAQYKQINWSDLAEQDPVQYLKLNQTYRDLKEARDGLAQEYNKQAQHLTQVQAENRQQALQAETNLLAKKVPEFVGKNSEVNKSHLKDFLSSEGFSLNEINNILDHRVISVAWKAAQYDKLKATKPAINKRVAEAPRVVKNTQNTNQKSQDRNDLRAKLARSGNGDIAAKLIEAML